MASEPERTRPASAVASGGDGEPWSVRRLLRWIETHLRERGVDSPRVAAEILVTHVLGCERIRLYMDSERLLNDGERTRLRDLVARAARHEPVQYLVGEWPFRGRQFEVGTATLIPRPSTETLVEEAVRWYRKSMPDQPLRMADIGTGTGIIAVSIMAELGAARREACAPLGSRSASTAVPTIQLRDDAPPAPRPQPTPATLRCLATDVVPEAVALAKRNVARHGLGSSIEVRLGPLFDPFRGSRPASFDLLCSNPPYVSDREWTELEPNVRDYEPASALRAGPDGLDVIRPLLGDAPHWLRPGGLLLVEIGHHQRDAVLALAKDRSTWSSADVLRDHEDFWRVLVAQRA